MDDEAVERLRLVVLGQLDPVERLRQVLAAAGGETAGERASREMVEADLEWQRRQWERDAQLAPAREAGQRAYERAMREHPERMPRHTAARGQSMAATLGWQSRSWLA